MIKGHCIIFLEGLDWQILYKERQMKIACNKEQFRTIELLDLQIKLVLHEKYLQDIHLDKMTDQSKLQCLVK